MFDLFKEFGLMVEVVIPPRRDKYGKRFGFVRFRKVSDESMLGVKLYNIFIKGKKIYANVSKFQRGKGVIGKLGKVPWSAMGDQFRGGDTKYGREFRVRIGNRSSADRSYAQVVESPKKNMVSLKEGMNHFNGGSGRGLGAEAKTKAEICTFTVQYGGR